MILTLISDTHTKHREIEDLPGGDILICAGDIMSGGTNRLQIEFFCKWMEEQPYKHKIFIAGNHDRLFEKKPKKATDIVDLFDVIYLQDSSVNIDGVKIYGSPWQPAFCNWAFNLPRKGEELEAKWAAIPLDTDILITHGPPFGHLDTSGWGDKYLGCERLRARVDNYPPKIHVFGHIHGSRGRKFHNDTHFINASVLDERYNPTHKPFTFEWDHEHNSLIPME